MIPMMCFFCYPTFNNFNERYYDLYNILFYLAYNLDIWGKILVRFNQVKMLCGFFSFHHPMEMLEVVVLIKVGGISTKGDLFHWKIRSPKLRKVGVLRGVFRKWFLIWLSGFPKLSKIFF